MKGKIKIEEYKIACIIGVYAKERSKIQEISISLELEYDWARCIESDNMVDAVNYEKIADACTIVAKKGRYHLLEKFAYDALMHLFSAFPIDYCKIAVFKKGAIAGAQAVSVELEKRR